MSISIDDIIENELQSVADQITSLTEKRLHLLKQLEILKESDE